MSGSRARLSLLEAEAESGSPPLRVLVLEPQEVTRLGLQRMLEALPFVHETIVADSISRAREMIAGGGVDVLIFPSDLRGTPLREILGDDSPRLLVIVRDRGSSHLAAAASLPAHGFMIQPDMTLEGLRDVLERMMEETAGSTAPAPRSSSASITDSHGPLIPTLTTREREVLCLLADGFTNGQIGSRLGISMNCVKRHVATILVKLNCANRAAAAAQAIRAGLLRSGAV